MTKHTITDSQYEFIFYNSPHDGKVRIHVNPYEETVWVTQKQMSAIFGVDGSGISRYLKNIFETGELVKNSVVAKFATTKLRRRLLKSF